MVDHRSHSIRPTRRVAGFTLVELMIVVLIITILAAIVYPRFSGASEMASESALAQDLHYLRTQVEVYTAQHSGIPPGYPNGDPQATPDAATFIAQMTNPTSVGGEIGTTPSATYRYGPYLDAVPVNPINGSKLVRVLTNLESMPSTPPASETGFGWIYKPATRELRAYVPGQDNDGRFYYEY